MTDTDKLKRLAEVWGFGSHSETILALIAENERLKGINAKRSATIADLVMEQAVRVMREATRAKIAEVQRDEAVALMREIYKDRDNLTDSMDESVSAFLARIDATNNTVA